MNRFDHSESKIDTIAEDLVEHIIDKSGLLPAASDYALKQVQRHFPDMTFPISDETHPVGAELFYATQSDYIQACLARMLVRIQPHIDEPKLEQAQAA